MENTKKMILVEPDFIEKFKHSEKAPLNSLTRLDEDMQKILASKIEDREKWALYSQALQRFLHLTETDRKPFKIPIIFDSTNNTHEDYEKLMVKKEKNEDYGKLPVKKEKNDDYEKSTVKKVENENNTTLLNPTQLEDDAANSTPSNQTYPVQFTPSHIIQLIPKSYMKKGQSLLDNILKNKQKIWWKEGGEIVVDNQVIPESNIIDLISDTLRPLKRAKPTGWKQFASILKDIGVPASCIGNQTNLEYIIGLQSNEVQKTPIYENTRSKSVKTRGQSTPISNKTAQLSKKKIDWERWSPY